MNFMEDIFDLIDDLPSEFRDMLISIRELDLMVQNALDQKEKEAKFFCGEAEGMQPAKRESVYEATMADFRKIMKDADEKVNIVERLEKLLMERLEQLDHELAQFKIRLETDNPGITATIEERMDKSDPEAATTTVTQKNKNTTQKPRNSRTKSSTSSSTVSSANEIPSAKRTHNIVSVKPAQAEAVSLVNETAVAQNIEAAVLPKAAPTYDLTTYCICQQFSYGEMIACDNPSCQYEWFHYVCVDVTTAPEGIWYCPSCRVDLLFQ